MNRSIAAVDDKNAMNNLESRKITGFGIRLKKTRESLGLTEKEAAAKLYLNPKIIEVIESETFFDGPPITFMKGYLRAYARLLEVPESDINRAIEELEIASTPTSSMKPSLQPSPTYQSDRYIRWFTYAISIVLIGMVFSWWQSHSTYVAPTENKLPSESATEAGSDTNAVDALPQTPSVVTSSGDSAQTITAPNTENVVAPVDQHTGSSVVAPRSSHIPHATTTPALNTIPPSATETIQAPTEAQATTPNDATSLPAPSDMTPDAVGNDAIAGSSEEKNSATKPKSERVNPIDIMALPEPG